METTRKLTLNLDEVKVDSFATAKAGEARGTVEGQELSRFVPNCPDSPVCEVA